MAETAQQVFLDLLDLAQVIGDLTRDGDRDRLVATTDRRGILAYCSFSLENDVRSKVGSKPVQVFRESSRIDEIVAAEKWPRSRGRWPQWHKIGLRVLEVDSLTDMSLI